jgi:capsular polysaccharide biosynthesis protein
MDKWASESIPYYLTRHGFKSILSREQHICARTLILPRIVPVVHPLLTRNFLDHIGLIHTIQDRVVLVSRTEGDGTRDSRLILNQNDLERRLREIYGAQFAVFHAGPGKEEEAIALFQRARIVIGSHGGAMYHAMWASKRAKVVELMAVQEDGRYPGMPVLDGPPPFAHLAIYTNAMMIGQRFYRWYEFSQDDNFEVRIDEFVAWLARVDLEESESDGEDLTRV